MHILLVWVSVEVRENFVSVFCDNCIMLIHALRPDLDFTTLATFIILCWKHQVQLNKRCAHWGYYLVQQNNVFDQACTLIMKVYGCPVCRCQQCVRGQLEAMNLFTPWNIQGVEDTNQKGGGSITEQHCDGQKGEEIFNGRTKKRFGNRVIEWYRQQAWEPLVFPKWPFIALTTFVLWPTHSNERSPL